MLYNNGDWSKYPEVWVLERTGYNYIKQEFDFDRAFTNNAISIGGPLLIRAAMKNVK